MLLKKNWCIDITTKIRPIKFKEFYENPPNINNTDSNRFIAEIAGKDSIAAVIYMFNNFESNSLLGIGLYHRGLYGNLSEAEEHFNFLQRHFLFKKLKSILFIYLDISDLFEQIILRTIATVQKYFGYFNPCPACHLLFHMIRIPIAKKYKITKFISGEREFHGNIQKLNQLPEILILLKELLDRHGIELIQPLRKVKKESEVYKIFGHQWKNNIRPEKCIFSKNYFDEEGNIPFNLKRIKNSLESFYFPLISEVVNFIDSQHNEPEELWFNKEILRIVNNFKK